MNNNFVLNRFFSQGTIMEMVNKGTSSVFETCVNQYLAHESFDSNEQVIQRIYNLLKRNYRNEYFYKNTLFNKLLLGRHSLNTTSALTELPINKSKADFVLMNGKAVVYEIKTELDTFDRLETQLEDYYKAFPIVYLVTSESNLERAEEFLAGTNTGLIILTKRNTLSNKKTAVPDFSMVEKKAMFNILRKKEFENIVTECFGTLPITTPVNYYRECFYLFDKVDIDTLYHLFINELKSRSKINQDEYLKNVPYELRFLVYFSKTLQEKYNDLNSFLSKVRGK